MPKNILWLEFQTHPNEPLEDGMQLLMWSSKLFGMDIFVIHVDQCTLPPEIPQYHIHQSLESIFIKPFPTYEARLLFGILIHWHLP